MRIPARRTIDAVVKIISIFKENSKDESDTLDSWLQRIIKGNENSAVKSISDIKKLLEPLTVPPAKSDDAEFYTDYGADGSYHAKTGKGECAAQNAHGIFLNTRKITSDPDDAISEIRDKSVTIVDVRRPEEYKKNHNTLLPLFSGKSTTLRTCKTWRIDDGSYGWMLRFWICKHPVIYALTNSHRIAKEIQRKLLDLTMDEA